MIDMCPKCGNYRWNKETSEDKTQIICLECGHQWDYKSLPLFILTGCSGVGKTTTAQELLQRSTDFIVLDGDFLYNLMPHETDEDYHNWIEHLMFISTDIMQSGKPLLWTVAGALSHFESAYYRRFFTEIHYLALVCSSEALEKRMREGRNITDENWIKSSIDYNQWFMTTGIVSDHKVDTYDITGKGVTEAADYVESWVAHKMGSISET